ncbi:hypothetical protein SAMN05421810_102831 [Amycolatopsis arida]|uniref:Uncharacterized protein n=1 Tax=Amycolatopsis arida TaxID=587909 RepID=A0A1I5R0S4_9PSEU|nr:hypothetical protein [Amycolatopsis arida]TDX99031.1 hypothetical protein CLV69_101832 [Amycolatopsis arida]SFP52083.1 hypothetical protein SAMN05421810_102831 [Amycolatopsis arida]
MRPKRVIEVSNEEIWTAWRTVRILNGDREGKSIDVFSAELRDAHAAVGHQGVFNGMGVLLKVLLEWAAEDLVLGPDQHDAVSTVLPPLLRRYRRTVPEQLLDLTPMVAGAMAAALLDHDVVEWRDQYGPPGPGELAAYGFVVWMVADFLDGEYRKGITNELLEAVLCEHAG